MRKTAFGRSFLFISIKRVTSYPKCKAPEAIELLYLFTRYLTRNAFFKFLKKQQKRDSAFRPIEKQIITKQG